MFSNFFQNKFLTLKSSLFILNKSQSKKYFSEKKINNSNFNKNNNKQKIKNDNEPVNQLKEERILLLDNENSKRYYKMNVLFLFGYLSYSLFTLQNKNLPSYLKSSILMFGSAASFALISLIFYSNRHIKRMVLIKRNIKSPTENFIQIENFRFYGFLNAKTFNVNISSIKEINPISKYLRFFNKTGLYIIKFDKNTKLFPIFNVMFMRPVKNNPYFDKIFIPKLKK